MKRLMILLALALLAPGALAGEVCSTNVMSTACAGGGSATGTVTGPGAACTDNALPRWNGATSTVLQCSDIIVDDSENVTGVGALTATNITDSALIQSRMVFAGVGGILSSDADCTFSTDTMTCTFLKASTNFIGTALVGPVGSGAGVNATAPAAANGASQAGTNVSLTASNAVASLDTAGAATGGSINITSGNAARNTSGNAAGGNITLTTGTGIGTGISGRVIVPDGTAAQPLFTGADSDTGIAFSAGGMDFGLNGTNSLSLSVGANGNVVTKLRSWTTTASGIPSFMVKSLQVQALTTTETPNPAQESEGLYTNGSDVDGVAVTLPDNPTAGECYEFAVTATITSNSFSIVASSGETVQDATTVCTTTPFSSTAKGSTARVCAVTGGSGALWFVMSKNGTWSCVT